MERNHPIRFVTLVLFALMISMSPGFAQPDKAQSSPLARYPGFGYNPKADEDQFEREEAAREDRIARCMEREGFTYWPMRSVALEGLESTRKAMEVLRDNPNDRYMLLLSEEGRLRYNRALYGIDNPDALEADRLRDPRDPRATGCAAEALRLIPGVFAAKSALTEELHAMRQAVLADQRVKAGEAQWSACMQKQGYSLESPRALRQQMDLQVAAALGKPESLKALGMEHRKALETSTGCIKQSSLDKIVASTRVDYERAFVKKHRKFLDDFLRTLEQEPLDER